MIINYAFSNNFDTCKYDFNNRYYAFKMKFINPYNATENLSSEKFKR